MKSLLIGLVFLMTPLMSLALTPQQYCEGLEAKSKKSFEILNYESNQSVKLCVSGRFCRLSMNLGLGGGDSIFATLIPWIRSVSPGQEGKSFHYGIPGSVNINGNYLSASAFSAQISGNGGLTGSVTCN